MYLNANLPGNSRSLLAARRNAPHAAIRIGHELAAVAVYTARRPLGSRRSLCLLPLVAGKNLIEPEETDDEQTNKHKRKCKSIPTGFKYDIVHDDLPKIQRTCMRCYTCSVMRLSSKKNNNLRIESHLICPERCMGATTHRAMPSSCGRACGIGWLRLDAARKGVPRLPDRRWCGQL